jgi:hypothetical protein
VKNLAKLVLFFTVSFVIILIAAGAAGLLHDWTEAAVFFPSADASGSLTAALAAALPAAIHLSLLLGISYGFRRKMAYPVLFIALLIFSVGLNMAASLCLNRLETALVFKARMPPETAKPGLLITVTPGSLPSQAVLLDGTLRGGRVLSLPGQPLAFEPAASVYRSRPVRLPFGQEITPILSDISADFARSARVLKAWFEAGMLPYAIYAGSLSLFMISLGCLVNISSWPLANLFFGALVFRGVLALESFLNSAEIHHLLASFAGDLVPESLINPIIFAALGVLVLLYSTLVFLARGRRSE